MHAPGNRVGAANRPSVRRRTGFSPRDLSLKIATTLAAIACFSGLAARVPSDSA